MLGVHHPLLKSIRKAAQRGARTDDGFAVAEGFHLYNEALRSRTPIGAILATEQAAQKLDPTVPCHLIDEATLAQISSVENSQGLITLLTLNEQPLPRIFDGPTLAIALDGIQDPGNAGAIVRSAEAFGATGVVFLKGSTNPWNPKALRASAGSLLRLPFALADWDTFLAEVESRRLPLYSAHPRAEKRIDEVPLNNPAAILIGNEGRGVPADHSRHATPVRIPTENVESLNAALAAGILLYEARRQRS
jgi:TrmH family RNA methyltransferase